MAARPGAPPNAGQAGNPVRRASSCSPPSPPLPNPACTREPSSDEYDSEEERAAARRAAAARGAAAAADQRAQAELLAAYRARQATRERLEQDTLAAKLRQQCGLEDGAWEGRVQHTGGGGDQEVPQARLRALQQHEGSWAALEAGSASCSDARSLTYADVPWPPLTCCTEYLRALAAWDHRQQTSQQQRCMQREQPEPTGLQQERIWSHRQLRRAYTRACLRWHPDKFEGRWGPALAPADRAAVLDRVRQLSQSLNTAWQELQERGACE